LRIGNLAIELIDVAVSDYRGAVLMLVGVLIKLGLPSAACRAISASSAAIRPSTSDRHLYRREHRAFAAAAVFRR
jgi:hypothetical protein